MAVLNRTPFDNNHNNIPINNNNNNSSLFSHSIDHHHLLKTAAISNGYKQLMIMNDADVDDNAVI